VSQATVTAELDEMAAAAERQAAAVAQAGQTPMTAKLASRSNALYAGVSLVLFQQITGQPSVLYYATSIFQAAGFAAESDATKVRRSSYGKTGCVQLLCSTRRLPA
jgi:hypothetical protein